MTFAAVVLASGGRAWNYIENKPHLMKNNFPLSLRWGTLGRAFRNCKKEEESEKKGQGRGEWERCGGLSISLRKTLPWGDPRKHFILTTKFHLRLQTVKYISKTKQLCDISSTLDNQNNSKLIFTRFRRDMYIGMLVQLIFALTKQKTHLNAHTF